MYLIGYDILALEYSLIGSSISFSDTKVMMFLKIDGIFYLMKYSGEIVTLNEIMYNKAQG